MMLILEVVTREGEAVVLVVSGILRGWDRVRCVSQLEITSYSTDFQTLHLLP